MNQLVFRSWILLLYFDFVMRFRSFQDLHDLIRKRRDWPIRDSLGPSSNELCHAVDLACVLYFKKVLCLQRSAVTTRILRRYGYDADMLIGAQVLPFRSHAWVEINKIVVNDKPYMREIYQVLERC
jgi:hypothetical protein